MTVPVLAAASAETSLVGESSKHRGGGIIIRQLKLRLNRQQEKKLNDWLWHLTGVYNFAIRKIELDARDSVYYSKTEFQNLLAGHSKRLGVSSHTMQGVMTQAYDAWQRCFKKIGKSCQ